MLSAVYFFRDQAGTGGQMRRPSAGERGACISCGRTRPIQVAGARA